MDRLGAGVTAEITAQLACEEACEALARARPDRSARWRMGGAQAAWFSALLLAAGLGWAFAPRVVGIAFAAAATALFGAAVLFRCLAAAGALVPAKRAAPSWDGPLPIYTLLCPLYREAKSAPGLVAALRRLDYPADKLQIVLVLEEDDLETLDAARLLDGVAIVRTPAVGPRTKPKALAYALRRALGEFICVYDAEDRPHPQQLRAALDAFAAGGPRLACVQAPLLIDNAAASWISAQFAVEYAMLFRQILPLLERCGAPVILGGTSNHFRAAALRDCGGWDPYNVTEDADLGYRLASDGWALGLIDPPTWEEAPTRLGAWTRQRSRWIKGHLQTWLVLMRAPIRLGRALGARGFWSMQLLLFGGVLAALLHAPFLALLIWAWSAQAPGPWLLAACGYGAALGAGLIAAAQTRNWRAGLAALTMPLYWPLAFPAACLALYELWLRPHVWAKTDHGTSARATPHL